GDLVAGHVDLPVVPHSFKNADGHPAVVDALTVACGGKQSDSQEYEGLPLTPGVVQFFAHLDRTRGIPNGAAEVPHHCHGGTMLRVGLRKLWAGKVLLAHVNVAQVRLEELHLLS